MRAVRADEDASSDGDVAAGSDGFELDDPSAEGSEPAPIDPDDVDLESDGVENGGTEPGRLAIGDCEGRECDIGLWLEGGLAQLGFLSLQTR